MPSTFSLTKAADKVFLALGQTLYACQMLEGTMLEIMATAHEILDGSGDGNRFYASLESLSRKTLGQLMHDLRKRADLRPDIEEQLSSGLEARNFIVHSFAKHVGDDLVNDEQTLVHQRYLYEKCMLIMNTNDLANKVLQALVRLQAEERAKKIAELETAATAMHEHAGQIDRSTH